MNFHKSSAEMYIPDQVSEEEALQRVTHLGIGAHPDDLELLAFHGIVQHFQRRDRAAWFGGVVCTHGGKGHPDNSSEHEEEDRRLRDLRKREQECAAALGQYGFVLQLDYSSMEARTRGKAQLKTDLMQVFSATHPEIIYTHNPADKHETHLSVMVSVIEALRELPASCHPARLLGCEVWRGLDWLLDEDKVLLDVSAREHLAAALLGLYDSQISGGKRYDLAVLGRWRANATFLRPDAPDPGERLALAMDLTPLLHDPSLSLVDYTQGYLQRFVKEANARLRTYWKG